MSASIYFAVWNNISQVGTGNNRSIVRGLGTSLAQLLKECGVNIHDFLNKIFHICQVLSSPREMLASLFQLKIKFSYLSRDIGDFDVLWRQIKSLRTNQQYNNHIENLHKELAWYLNLIYKGKKKKNNINFI